MTVGAHHRCEVGEHVRLGTTDAHEGGQRLERSCTLGARRAHAIELPRALRGARRPDRRHRVSEPAIGQQGRVPQVRGGREHVELQPDRRAGPRPRRASAGSSPRRLVSGSTSSSALSARARSRSRRTSRSGSPATGTISCAFCDRRRPGGRGRPTRRAAPRRGRPPRGRPGVARDAARAPCGTGSPGWHRRARTSIVATLRR